MTAKNAPYLHNWERWSHGLKRFGYDHCFTVIYEMYNKSSDNVHVMKNLHIDKGIGILHSFDSRQKMHKKCQELVVSSVLSVKGMHAPCCEFNVRQS